ncbi:MAG: hypothetical protein ACLU62_08025 [Hydrogeniiclostridium sp.]
MKSIKLGFLIFSIFLLYIACIHILLPQLNNWKLLLQGKNNSYLQFQPLNGDILYTELSEAAGNQWSAILSSPSINEVIVPKKDIYYYNSPNDPVPAYIVHAGKLYEDEPIGGYGFITWPTGDAEWRYGRPFIEGKRGGALIPIEDIKGLPYYYVRFSDLINLRNDIPNSRYSNKNYMEHYDWLLYQAGLYYSPNLHALIFDAWNLGFLAAGLMLLGVTLFWMHKSRKKDAVSQRLANNSDKGIST